ncbi:MAG: hypothetical protein KDC53_23470 [Saprospiraceae bacterium]|nr:hypothetical protein [Saprospiraceae bacterium]
MGRFWNLGLVVIAIGLLSCQNRIEEKISSSPVSISGIYPHLAHYNQEGECGTGAVVPWADRLWIITYGPHLPFGSSDKLYEISPDLDETMHSESIGGTPANRMIHRESNQLFIGPYVINDDRSVKVIPYSVMPGRLTGNARHLFDPVHKIYYATMEEGFYEVDVASLSVTQLYKDSNQKDGQHAHDPTQVNPENATLPGAHGKGLYSGQGVLVYSNNGEATEEALQRFDVEAGVLAEWDGENWKTIRRNQFVEVTGPGGIYGNKNPETDPIWVTGWDHKSIIVGVRDPDHWHFYRLPKASHSYDGAHGWNTEWPRIRNVGTEGAPDFLMTMHGMFWHFPGSFSGSHSAGIRPRSAYLKVIGDFCRWDDQLVFGCDDSAQKEFLNKRKLKGNIEGPGQSNSNLWFTSAGKPDSLGIASANGALYIEEMVQPGVVSEPFLFSGWTYKMIWVHSGKNDASLVFEIDEKGDNQWSELKSIQLKEGESQVLDLSKNTGEWIRVRSHTAAQITVSLNYSEEEERNHPENTSLFSGLVTLNDKNSLGGLLYGLGDNKRKLGLVPYLFSENEGSPEGYYELDAQLNLVKVNDPKTERFIKEKFAIPDHVVTIDSASVLVVDDKNRRWRFPKGNEKYTMLTDKGHLRICREVATERDLFNCHGTFYELPAENADGMAKVRPIASHNLQVHDYASYRGMLVMTGVDPNISKENKHIIRSPDGKAAVWLGVIDDLWSLGKPVGKGGPWRNSDVQAGTASDPYLIGFYDKKKMRLSHNLQEPVQFIVEVEPIGHGPWMIYQKIEVKPGEDLEFNFPAGFQARWIRFKTDKNCRATAWLEYY